MEKLTVEGILKNGIAIGLKNVLALFVNALLWGLTIWIPYLNVGTTIGLFVGVTAKASKGDPISFTEIFDAKYRKRMGEYFLNVGLVGMGSMFGFIMFIVPGIVISLAWSLSALFTVDKEMNPLEAINKSNEVTYGNKATIFLGQLVLGIIGSIALGIVGAIFGMIHPFLALIAAMAGMALFASVMIGANAYIYQVLGSKV